MYVVLESPEAFEAHRVAQGSVTVAEAADNGDNFDQVLTGEEEEQHKQENQLSAEDLPEAGFEGEQAEATAAEPAEGETEGETEREEDLTQGLRCGTLLVSGFGSYTG